MKYARTAIAFITTLFAFTTPSSIYDSSRAQTTRSSSGAAAQISRSEKGNCTTSYDRFRNRNTTTLAPRAIMTAGSEELRLGFSAVTEGDAAPHEIEWLFDSTTERQHYGNKAEVPGSFSFRLCNKNLIAATR